MIFLFHKWRMIREVGKAQGIREKGKGKRHKAEGTRDKAEGTRDKAEGTSVRRKS